MTKRVIHEGQNLRRLREILRIKQSVLAGRLGISQQAVSALERKAALGEPMRQRLSEVLGVPELVIPAFHEEALRQIIILFFSHQLPNFPLAAGSGLSFLSQYVEMMEENRRLYQELLRAREEKLSRYESGKYPDSPASMLLTEAEMPYYVAN